MSAVDAGSAPNEPETLDLQRGDYVEVWNGKKTGRMWGAVGYACVRMAVAWRQSVHVSMHLVSPQADIEGFPTIVIVTKVSDWLLGGIR